MREFIHPTVLTIVILAFTGLYGFVKFSHENDFAIDDKAIVGLEKPTSIVSTTGYYNVEHPVVDYARPLITYSYSESRVARQNLAYFIEHGLHDGADFVFILNGLTNAGTLIPEMTNVRVIPRSDPCSDLGAHGEILLKDELWKKYIYFIMMDSNIRGPFMPYWSQGCWSDAFLNRLTKDVKLVGTAATCHPKFHIEPSLWATDEIGMNILLSPFLRPAKDSLSLHQRRLRNPISLCSNDGAKAGIAVSALTSAGYSVDALAAAYHITPNYAADCLLTSTSAASNLQPKQSALHMQYYARNPHPYETIFIPANSDVDVPAVNLLTEFFKPRGAGAQGSWAACR
ncbi:hypothetical protein F5Y11DRAFT_7714 [Daldinia sp. FL1419]|nr:hypothetical protein F5Y11DRAFT_7714 [Daldinia sp. FL1419]